MVLCIADWLSAWVVLGWVCDFGCWFAYGDCVRLRCDLVGLLLLLRVEFL